MSGTQVIAIVGSGAAACGLACRAADAGHEVRLYHGDSAALALAQGLVRDAVERAVTAGRLDPGRRQRVLDGILATDDLTEAVTHASLIVEAADCSGAERRRLVMRLGEASRASAVVATVADPDALMDYLPNPGRLLGLRLPLDLDAPEGSEAEVVPGVETVPHALERARHFLRELGLEPRLTAPRAG